MIRVYIFIKSSVFEKYMTVLYFSGSKSFLFMIQPEWKQIGFVSNVS